MEKNKGFEIKCLDCGSTRCVVTQDIDYDSRLDSPYIVCLDCYQSSC